MLKKALCILSATLILCACATTPPPADASRTELPPPDSAVQRTAEGLTYKIKPRDTLDVAVFRQADLNRSAEVSRAGTFGMPLLGEIEVQGLTSAEVAAKIRAALQQTYLRDPQVTVNIRPLNTDRFTVDGAVQAPGVYDMDGEFSLLQAVATARSGADTADMRQVVIFRVVGGQKVAGVYDLRAIRNGQAPDPKIYNGDIVMVPYSNSAWALRQAVGAIPILSLLYSFTRR